MNTTIEGKRLNEIKNHLTLINAEGGIMAKVLRTVPIAQIILDEAIYPRSGVYPKRVTMFVENIRDGFKIFNKKFTYVRCQVLTARCPDLYNKSKIALRAIDSFLYVPPDDRQVVGAIKHLRRILASVSCEVPFLQVVRWLRRRARCLMNSGISYGWLLICQRMNRRMISMPCKKIFKNGSPR